MLKVKSILWKYVKKSCQYHGNMLKNQINIMEICYKIKSILWKYVKKSNQYYGNM